MQSGRAKTGLIRAFSTLLGAVGSVLLIVSPASAGWSAPTTVSGPGSSVSQTRIAGTADGTAWVVWKRDVGGFDVIQGTKVTPGGSPGPIQTLSAPGAEATDPVIETRPDGSALVAWLNLSAADATVTSRSIAANGTLGPISARSAAGPAGQPAKDISVALGSDGSAALSWLKFNGTFWVAQAVRVGPDGTSGTLHNLSGLGSATPPDIAAVPSAIVGEPSAYRSVWAQGPGASASVYTREISADGAVGETVKLLWPRIPVNSGDPAGPGTGGDPQDVSIAYAADGDLNIAWVRTRTDYIFLDPLNPVETPYENRSVEAILAEAGQVISNDLPLTITPLTPVVYGVPYNVEDLDMSVPEGGEAVLTWVHNMNGGGQRVETGRYLRGIYREWVNGTGVVPAVQEPEISANKSAAAVLGWSVPGVFPGQDTVGLRRFSNGSIDQPSTPTGDFVYSRDFGSVVAEDGTSLAAFTAVDGGNVGTARLMVYTDPAIRVDPTTLNFGRGDIGFARVQPVTIRSAGQTPVSVSGVTLSGADAANYSLNGASKCIRKIAPGSVCVVKVRYRPSTTATQNATVTVTSELGVNEVSLTGRGLNRTRNRITLNRRNFSARKGKVVRVRATVRNTGGVASNNTRVCVNLRKRALKLAGKRCRRLGAVPAKANRTLNYRIRVTWRAPRGRKLPVTFVLRANNAVVRQTVARVRRKGR